MLVVSSGMLRCTTQLATIAQENTKIFVESCWELARELLGIAGRLVGIAESCWEFIGNCLESVGIWCELLGIAGSCWGLVRIPGSWTLLAVAGSCLELLGRVGNCWEC